MPFSADRTAEIQSRIRSRLERKNVNDWERSFLSNMDAKFAKDGTRTNLSKAQYAKLHKILGLERELNAADPRPNTPSKPVRRSSRPVQPQSQIKAARRIVNAPKRTVRRMERQLVLPLLVVVGVVALIGSLFATNANSPASRRTDPTTVDVPRASYVFVTGSRVNQRRGPSTSHAVIGSLADGTRVEVLSRNGQWTNVR